MPELLDSIQPPLYLPFQAGHWHLSLGLKALPLSQWIGLDQTAPLYFQRKAELLQENRTQVLAALPGSEAGQQEVLDLLLEHLPVHFPESYQRRERAIANSITQEIWNPNDFVEMPIDLAGRLVQEDLCLLAPDATGYVLVAASLCFPSHWRLEDKLGKPIAHIHTPVPGYAQKLERRVDAYCDRLQPDTPGYRFNWVITDTPELHLGHSSTNQTSGAGITAENAGEKLWLRVERQTLRRLPRSQHILFTIRTYIYPFSTLKQHPEAAANFLATLSQIPSEMQLYKSLQPIQAALRGYLQSN